MNNERISRVLAKMEEKGLTQLIVSDPLSIRFLTGIMVNPGERLYALDRSYKLRFSHENPAVLELYKSYLGAPLSHKAHELLHTDQGMWEL